MVRDKDYSMYSSRREGLEVWNKPGCVGTCVTAGVLFIDEVTVKGEAGEVSRDRIREDLRAIQKSVDFIF